MGEEHLFLRFAGCPLRCRYCDTPGSLTRTHSCNLHLPGEEAREVPNPIAQQKLAAIVERTLEARPSIQRIAVTGGEPLAQWRFLASFLPRARELRPVLLETAGVHGSALHEVIAWVDVVSMDIKLPSNSGERPFWSEHEAFLAVARAKQVYVKILVDEATVEAEVDRAVELVHRVSPTSPIFLQPVHGDDGRPLASAARLQALFLRARSGHPCVRVLPQVHKLLGIP